MAGEQLMQGFFSEANFGFGRQEHTSKPPQAMCKPLAKKNCPLLGLSSRP
jgi:hypothetical protein